MPYYNRKEYPKQIWVSQIPEREVSLLRENLAGIKQTTFVLIKKEEAFHQLSEKRSRDIIFLSSNQSLLDLARDLLVDEEAMVEALAAGKIKKYVSDFPNPTTVGAKGCIVTPHLGASTAESEDNCAIMAVREIRDYMENGNIVHSVNFPDCSMGACTTAGRIGILHRNVSGMISQYSTTLGDAGMNIAGMTNKSKGDYAYVLIDVDSPVTDEVIQKLENIEGVLKVRKVK